MCSELHCPGQAQLETDWFKTLNHRTTSWHGIPCREERTCHTLCFPQYQLHLADASPVCSHGLLTPHTQCVSHYKVTPKWQIAVSEVCHLSAQRCVVSHVHWSRAGMRFVPIGEVPMGFSGLFSHIALFHSF